MTIIRSPRVARDFTVISNSVCLDDRLSMRSLGLLVRLLCRPDNWKTNSETLAREFGVGREQMRSTLQELVSAGYMALQKQQDAAGHWSSHWVVFDEPAKQPEPSDPKPGQPEPGKPYVGELGAITRTDLTRTDNKAPRKRSRPASPADHIGVEDLMQDGLSEEVAKAWIAHRKRKKAGLTPLAWKGIKAEAAKAGWPLQAAIEKALARGWQSFDAAFVERERPAGASAFAGVI